MLNRLICQILPHQTFLLYCDIRNSMKKEFKATTGHIINCSAFIGIAVLQVRYGYTNKVHVYLCVCTVYCIRVYWNCMWYKPLLLVAHNYVEG